jgi:choline dehydrogenase-like flavoprotein
VNEGRTAAPDQTLSRSRRVSILHQPPGDGSVFDVCVIGSGPAGLAVALACEARNLSTLILESGGMKPRGIASSLPPIRVLNRSVHAALDIATREGFGGTSRAWGGLCVPLDPIDFEARDWVPHSGWPITYTDLARWYPEAAGFLDSGRKDLLADGGEISLADEATVTQNGYYARKAFLADVYGARVRHSKHLVLCLHSTVTGMDCDATGERISSLTVRGRDRSEKHVRARRYVLACGGLRSTALLLQLRRDRPACFSADAPLGRYYMGHLAGEIATVVFPDPMRAAEYLYRSDEQGFIFQKRTKLADSVQRTSRILNTDFMLRLPPLADGRHGSPALSLLQLLALIPGLGGIAQSNRLSRTLDGRDPISASAHLRNLAVSPLTTANDLAALLRHVPTRNLPLLSFNRSGRYSLRYHAEQIPNPDSRVSLRDAADETSFPGLEVDFRYSGDDALSVIRSHELLDQALRRDRLGYLEYRHPPDQRFSAVLAQASDGYHQVGTTRMGSSPRLGVVDRDCRVYGMDNLYLASSSVFPTTGSANPTFPTVALALRLADHLASIH